MAASALVQFLGIVVTAALFQTWSLIQLTRKLAHQHNANVQLQNLAAPNAPLPDPPEDTSLPLPEFVAYMLLKVRNSYHPPVQLPTNAPPQRPWLRILLYIFGAFSAFAIYAGVVAAGVMTNVVEGDSKVLSTSSTCGPYMASSLGEPLYKITTPLETRAQLEIASYANLCYQHGNTAASGCDRFLRAKINYTVSHDQPCPFGSGMCYLGDHGALTLSTGATAANALGINANSNLQFNRSVTCAPINMNNTYVVYGNDTSSDCTKVFFSYRYGAFDNDPQTTKESIRTFTYGDFYEKTPSYLVNAMATIPGTAAPARGEWHVIPELASPVGTVFTMLFILPGKIYYLERSDDPIFNATANVTVPLPNGGGQEAWMYLEGYARVLACVDRAQWRNLKDGPHWHERHERPNSEPSSRMCGDEWLLWFSLQPSNIYQTISKRLGAALNASNYNTQYNSLPLAPEQWKVEAMQLFEKSLVRAQFEAQYISDGVYAEYPGYERMRTPELVRKICHGVYLSNNSKYRNIPGAIYLLLLCLSLIPIILSAPWDDRVLIEIILGARAGSVAAVLMRWSRKLMIGLGKAGLFVLLGFWWIIKQVGIFIDKSATACLRSANAAPPTAQSGTSAGQKFMDFFRNLC